MSPDVKFLCSQHKLNAAVRLGNLEQSFHKIWAPLLFEQLSLTLKTSVVPRKWWNHINLNEFYPLLSLSLELHYERGQDISKLLNYLDATNQAVICNKINESITNYLAKSKDINCVKRFVFAIA